jgi:transmembrane sensor
MGNNFTYMDDDLLGRYFSGEAGVNEQMQIDKWAEASSSNRKQLEDYKKIFSAKTLPVPHEINAEDALHRLNCRLTKKSPLGLKIVLRYAATLAVICSAGLLISRNLIASKLSVHTNENTLTQILPDGSTAILNKKSSILFAGGLLHQYRQVSLKGEAFFKVSPNKEKPFVIDVNNIKITVVGTEFNVKGGDKLITVVVERGLVKVSNGKDSIRLSAGEKLVLTEKQLHLRKNENRGKLYNYYFSNELICNQTPLLELVTVLNEKFKSKIIISNPDLNTLPISTTFKNESLTEILKVIAETFKIKIAYGNGIITLK